MNQAREQYRVLTVDETDGILRVHLPFSFTIENDPSYREKVEHDFHLLATHEASEVHLDLSEVQHANSQFIGQLVRLSAARSKFNKPLSVTVSPCLMEICRLLHLGSLFKIEEAD